jgi:hypothetical protein
MIPFTDDRIAKRLRWVMLGVMLFSMTATLSGQSQEFWTHPDRAIRFDGLSIYNATNHKFEFFLSYGWEAYVFACFAYFAVAFVFVSVLPRRPALIAVFSGVGKMCCDPPQVQREPRNRRPTVAVRFRSCFL